MPFKKVINLGPAQAQTISSSHLSRMSRLCNIARLGNEDDDDGPTLESSQQLVHALNLKLNPGSKLKLDDDRWCKLSSTSLHIYDNGNLASMDEFSSVPLKQVQKEASTARYLALSS